MEGENPSGEIAARLVEELGGFRDMIGGISGRAGSADISEIVLCYYGVISMSATIRALGPVRDDAELAGLVADAEGMIREFDSRIHPVIMSRLAESVEEQTASLKSGAPGGADRAALFEKLRKTMSTREFVGQYDGGTGP